MRRKSKENPEVKIEREITEAALDLAHIAIKGTADTQALATQALDTAGEAVGLLRKSQNMVEDLRRYIEENEPLPTDALTPEEVKMAAELYPQWSIKTGFANGEATKVYTRTLDDTAPEVSKRDIYRQFCDAEYFDHRLADLFQGYGTGEIGQFPHLTVITNESTPISHTDIARIDIAERYLVEQGIIRIPESSTEAVS